MSSAGPGGGFSELSASAARYVQQLCLPYPDRHVGGPGNLAATALFAETVSNFGFDVSAIAFPCVDWDLGEAWIEVGGLALPLHCGPYSRSIDVSAPLLAASSVEELERGGTEGHVLLLHGDIVREQLTPKNYPFYRWDAHTKIIEAIERAAPAAIVAATGRSSELVGSPYPFPLVEDADFEIPSAYLTDVDGAHLLEHVGRAAHLVIASGRHASTADQVVARVGRAERRVVVSAHIDSRRGSPGAIDNGTGVAALLLVAELLADHEGALGVEIVPFNGEDDYAAPGEVAYLAERGARLAEEVSLNINIDGVGWVGHDAEMSLYECPHEIALLAREELLGRERVTEGAAWPQSDHMIFAMRGIPAVALTTADASGLRREIAHTAADIPAVVDPDVVADVAAYVAGLVRRLTES